MLWLRNRDGSFSVSGEGPMREIVAEGETRPLARAAWMHEFGRQYEEQEKATALSIYTEKNYEDLRMLASEIHSYKGPAR